MDRSRSLFLKRTRTTYGSQMSGGDGQTDGQRRRDRVAPGSFVTHRVDDQDQYESDDGFHDESLARFERGVYGRLAQTFGHPVRRDKLQKKKKNALKSTSIRSDRWQLILGATCSTWLSEVFFFSYRFQNAVVLDLSRLYRVLTTNLCARVQNW